ncbi:MAG: hypothetical protein SVU32_05995, partial [Candidatus Nanohaloarchaea archaeon]|nr:hypothetical protein [Candidatus Nanohaloarchaea archaeon]
MLNGTRTRFLVLTLLCIAFSSGALAGVTVEPQYVYGDNKVNYTVEITNDAASGADTVYIQLPTTSGGPDDVFNLQSGDDITPPAGWNASAVSRDGDTD